MPGEMVADMIWLGRGLSSLEQRRLVGDDKDTRVCTVRTQNTKDCVQFDMQSGRGIKSKDQRMRYRLCLED